jgi:multicomponent Na+:H+ antiporter subunit B
MSQPRSYIFTAVGRFAFFIINVFAIYLFFRGHDLPGGGFIAGLASATSLILLSLAIGIEEMSRIMRVDPVRIASLGMLIAIGSGAAPMLFDYPFLTQFNWHLHDVPLFGDLHVGMPMVFDLGVYLVVIGICCKIIFVLTQSMDGHAGLVAEGGRLYSSPVEDPIDLGPSEEEEDIDAN